MKTSLDKNFEELLNRFHTGDIVYYACFYGMFEYKIAIGIVDYVIGTDVHINRLEPKVEYLINGKPAQDFDGYSKWQKAPKPEYDSLGRIKSNYTLSRTDYTDEENELYNSGKFEDPAHIKKLYESGLFVQATDNYHPYIKEEYDTKLGYRLHVKNTDYDNARTWSWPYVSRNVKDVYFDCEELKTICEAKVAEANRRANLSDYDYSIEEIDMLLNRWQKCCDISQEDKLKTRIYLLKKKWIEDLVVRLVDKKLWFRYECCNILDTDKKHHTSTKWMPIDVNDVEIRSIEIPEGYTMNDKIKSLKYEH